MRRAVRAAEASAAAEWEWRIVMLATRSDGRCECCGRPFEPGVRDPSVHHRRPRRMGGSRLPDVHSLANLLYVCGGAYAGTVGCHGWIEANRTDAYSRGFLVEAGHDPAAVPVVVASGRRVLLDADSPWYLPPADGIAYELAEFATPDA